MARVGSTAKLARCSTTGDLQIYLVRDCRKKSEFIMWKRPGI